MVSHVDLTKKNGRTFLAQKKWRNEKCPFNGGKVREKFHILANPKVCCTNSFWVMDKKNRTGKQNNSSDLDEQLCSVVGTQNFCPFWHRV